MPRPPKTRFRSERQLVRAGRLSLEGGSDSGQWDREAAADLVG